MGPEISGEFDSVLKQGLSVGSALDYLRAVDPEAAAHMQSRVETFLPVLRGTNGYGDLKESERNTLTAAIADLVSLMERQRLAYVAKSSKEDFDWAERAAIGARQTDTWFRRMPLGWKLEDGFEWTRHATQVRDRVMADNLEWVRGRLGPRGRVIVFTAAGHLASTVVQLPDHQIREMVPLGAHLKDRFGSDFVNILSSWLHQVHDHWNGFGTQRFATAGAFDLVYYVSPVTSACTPEVEATP